MCCAGDGRRGAGGGDVWLRRHRHGRHDLVPTGALGAAARVGEVSSSELTSANAVRGLLDSLATLGGPVVAAVLLAASGPAAVFAACSAASLLAGLVVVALPYDAPPRAETAPGGGREMLQGFTTIAADRRARADHGARGGADVHARLPDRVRRGG